MSIPDSEPKLSGTGCGATFEPEFGKAAVMTFDDQHDKRVQRTQMAIFDAFRELVLSRRYTEIKTADIIARAEIGRSTFYEHFDGKDDVLLRSIKPLFAVLAGASVGNADGGRIQFVLAHFWEQRAFARIIFHGDLYEKLTRKLAEMIEQRLTAEAPAQARMQSISHAASMLSVIRAWLAGEFSMTVDDLTRELLGGGAQSKAVAPRSTE